MKKVFEQCVDGLSRRDLFRRGSVLAAAPAFFGRPAAAAPAAPVAAGKLQLAPGNIYQSFGVRPLINCRGTLTVISGSLELPEVRAAVEAAGQHHVVLDELMEAAAKRLAEITGAEWALISSGCAAGMAHTTAACVTGGNPDLHVRIPDLTGFAKDEVVIPKASRNEYDQAIRSVGVRIIEVGDAAEYEAALGPKVAMVYIMSGNRMESGPLTYDASLRDRQEEEYSRLHRRRGRDAHSAEYLPAARVHVCRVQRRKMSARAAVLRPRSGPQRPAPGRMGVERAAPRPRPHHENRQGRDCGSSGRGRDVGAARSHERGRNVDAVDADHCGPRHQDRRCHGGRSAAQGSGQPQSGAVDQLGSGQAGDYRRGGLKYSVDHRTAHCAGRRWWWRRTRGPRRRPFQPNGNFNHRVHDDARRRQGGCRPRASDPFRQAAAVETGDFPRHPPAI